MTQPPGPLTVSSTNHRYFAAAAAPEGRSISRATCQQQLPRWDGGRDCPENPERFDFAAYLELLTERGHNFIRLWRWEQFRGQLGPANALLHDAAAVAADGTWISQGREAQV